MIPILMNFKRTSDFIKIPIWQLKLIDFKGQLNIFCSKCAFEVEIIILSSTARNFIKFGLFIFLSLKLNHSVNSNPILNLFSKNRITDNGDSKYDISFAECVYFGAYFSPTFLHYQVAVMFYQCY